MAHPGTAPSAELGRWRRLPQDGSPIVLAGLDAVEELRAEARERDWTELHVVPVLATSGAARDLICEVLPSSAALECCLAERLLTPPAWGRLDRLVALGLPEAAAAAQLAGDIGERLAAPIDAGRVLVALTLRTTVYY